MKRPSSIGYLQHTIMMDFARDVLLLQSKSKVYGSAGGLAAPQLLQ